MSEETARVKVTWTKSAIGYAENQKRTIVALGLHRLHQSVEHEASPAVLGMIRKVSHLVTTETVEPKTAPPGTAAPRSEGGA